MDAISQSALASLETVLSGYLPATTAANIERDLIIIPQEVKPTGIGGYIGLNNSPVDEIYGRYIRADAEINIGATNNNSALITTEINSLTSTLATLGRETLRTDGVYFLKITSLSPAGQDNGNSRTLTVSVHYEYQEIPVDAGETINRIDYREYLNPTDNSASVIASLDFSTLTPLPDPLVDFLPLADTDVIASSPSENWAYNSVEQRIEQTNAVRGGGASLASARKAGAQLLYVPQGRALSLGNGIMTSTMSTNQNDGIGFVFRWQDIDNFYFFLISTSQNYQIFGKKVAGTWSFLEQGGIGEQLDLNLASPTAISIEFYDNHLTAKIDDTIISSGTDSDLISGEVGLLTHINSAAFFHTLDIVRLT